MAHKLYINLDERDLRKALVLGRKQPSVAVKPPDLVVGADIDVEVYLLHSDGDYDVRSGLSGYTLRLGAGPRGAIPNDGSATLTDGTETTAALDYNATAAVIQAALNALNNGDGPFSDLVTVKLVSRGSYLVTFDTVGAQSALSGDGALFKPESSVVVSEVTAGGVATKEVQLIQFLRQPAIYLEFSTQITNGWSGSISANNSRILQLMAGDPSITTDFEVRLQRASETPDVIVQTDIKISGEVTNDASFDGSRITADDAVREDDADRAKVRLDITGLIGGAVTDLDGIETVDLSTGRLYLTGVTIAAAVPSQMWVLITGTAAEDPANGIVRPDDYAAGTNEKIWKAYESI